jgi:CDP-alcohol phosphatidyltransferase
MPRHRPRLPVVLYVPNLLGYTRIGLALVGLQYATTASPTQPHSPVVAVAIWLVATSLDLVDGVAARALRQTSKFGSLLDIMADNILRTSIWIAAVAASAAASNDAADKEKPAWVTETLTTTRWGPWVSWTLPFFASVVNVPIGACVVICLEWMTMVSTQVPLFATNASEQQHWKTARQKDPWIVQAFFCHNFCNVWGAFGIFGLFSANLFCYASYHVILYRNIPGFYTLRAVAYSGRLLAAYIELWFCRSFWSIVLDGDERSRQSKQVGLKPKTDHQIG